MNRVKLDGELIRTDRAYTEAMDLSARPHQYYEHHFLAFARSDQLGVLRIESPERYFNHWVY